MARMTTTGMTMTQMTIEEMRIRKTQLRYTYAKIAELSGLPLGTVQKVLTGATASPRISTMRALEAVLKPGASESDSGKEAAKDGLYPYSQQPYFEELLRERGKETEKDGHGRGSSSPGGTADRAGTSHETGTSCGTGISYGTGTSCRAAASHGTGAFCGAGTPDRTGSSRGTGAVSGMVMEPEPAYHVAPHPASPNHAPHGNTIFGNPRGQYTLQDYYALPDDQRVELIDGYFFIMEAPTSMHQELLVELVFRFKDYQRKKRPDCRVFPAPFDVQLDRDVYTMLQPDISIICDRSRIVRRGCFGAPDFVVEILSDSTRAKDMYLKLAKYREAGVREYWIVDPRKRKVLVYFYEDEDRIAVYGMDSKVPVGISGGDLEIDFAEIMEELRYLEDLTEEE